MNYNLAKEIYGMTPWFVDQQSLPALLSIVDSFKNGSVLEIPETKYNTVGCLEVYSDTRIVDRPYSNGWTPGQLDNNEDFIGVGIINIDGPITVNGGQSTVGMRSVSNLMNKMALDKRIVSFIVLCDSGGGASMAVEIMSKTIKDIDKIKPVFGLIKEGGMAASACYGIVSAARKVYAVSEMSIVGSAGTMMQFEGREANVEGDDKIKHIRLYAPESTKKNEGFEAALNKDDYSIIVDQMLKPMNDSFLNLIESNRPMLKGTNFRDGHTQFAKDSVGTFIDGIKSFKEVVEIATSEEVIKESKKNNAVLANNNSKLNQKAMTVQELKTAHPETYNSIFTSGVAEGSSGEKDRAGAWMAHAETDLPAVKAGIESGNPITATSREELLVKASSLTHLNNLQVDTKIDVKVIESKDDEITPEQIKEEAEVEAFYGSIDKKLNPSKS